MRGTLAERLVARIDIDDNACWIWQGYVTPNGYGLIGDGRGRAGTSIYTHRASYELHVGPIPEGLDIDHLCRVRACCNPQHLEPVTRAENLRRSPLVGRASTKQRKSA